MPNNSKKSSNLPVANRYPILPFPFEVTKGVHFHKVHFEEREEEPVAAPASSISKKPKSTSPIPLHIRRLKVTEQYVSYVRKNAPLYSFRPRCAHLPQIKLSGRWLEKAGFTMCSFVDIFVSDGLLIIKPAEE